MNKKILWIIIGVLLLAIVLVLGYKWINSDSTEIVTTDVTNTDSTTAKTRTLAVENRATDILSVVKSIPEASKFTSLLSSTGVSGSIKAGTKYTLFVPTDAAFQKMPSGYLNNLSSADLKRLVQYHVVSGRALDTDATSYGTIQALSMDNLNFSSGADKLPRVNSSVILKQYITKNGTIYMINVVLLPPEKPKQ